MRVAFRVGGWRSIFLLEHNVALVVDYSPIYTAENFLHGSDEKSTRTEKIGSVRIDLAV